MSLIEEDIYHQYFPFTQIQTLCENVQLQRRERIISWVVNELQIHVSNSKDTLTMIGFEVIIYK